MLAHSSFIRVLATYKLHGRAEGLIRDLHGKRDIWEQSGFNHKVLLCALVDSCGAQQDWQRADRWWDIYITEFGVEPDVFAYNASAKVHMLCGRPNVAASKLDEMMARNVALNSKTAIDHAQALLLTYHSSLLQSDLQRLLEALKKGSTKLRRASKWEKQTWQKINASAERLRLDPASLKLQDVLVEWKAASQSIMSDWENFSSGSGYLQRTL